MIFPSRRRDGCKGTPPFSIAHSPCTEVTALTLVPPLVQLVKTAELDPRQNYLVGFHPHGVLAVGAFINFGTEATGFSTIFPGITPHLMTLSLWFRVPFLRDYLMSAGKRGGSADERRDERVNQMVFREQRGETSGRPENVKESFMSGIYRCWILKLPAATKGSSRCCAIHDRTGNKKEKEEVKIKWRGGKGLQRDLWRSGLCLSLVGLEFTHFSI